MPPHRARLHIGYVPQNARLDVAVPANVLDVVLMGRLGRSKWGFRYNSRDKHRAYDALEQVGVADLAKRPVTALSGGQRQRVLIARALVSQARILMLDEPTAGVDEMAEQGLYDLLKRLNRDVPIVLVSHDIAFVTVHMKHVACLNKNVVMHNAAEISRDVITKMYTPPPGESFVEGPHAVELRRIDHDHHECVDGHVHGPDCGHDHEHGEKPGGASSS